MGDIIKRLCDIQAEVEAIAKERRNAQQGYNFRGVEDVLNMVHRLLAKHRVIVCTRKVGEGRLEERPTKSGGLMITRVFDYEFDFVAEDASTHTVGPIPGEGADSGDKSSNKTVANAYKYCIFFTFSIPTQDLVTEPDQDSPEASTRQSSGNGTGNGHRDAERKATLDKIGALMKSTYPAPNGEGPEEPLFSEAFVGDIREKVRKAKSLPDLRQLLQICELQAKVLIDQRRKGATSGQNSDQN